ncbi:MAG: 30S ribosomal protein S17 [Alcaligenaceae bacterium]|nr:30S ribosomal protein S17 [Alcaligenaceae bacterium]
MSENTKKCQRTLKGKVVSNKMDKTVVVLVESRIKHPLYGKFVVQSKKYKAHDENNQYNEGDIVEIAEQRPISRHKSWTVTRLIEAVRVI